MKVRMLGLMVLAAGVACGQATMPGGGVGGGSGGLPVVPGKVPVGPGVPLDDKVRAVLKVLQDRPATLKDFVGTVDYSVKSGLTDDVTGKLGKIAYLSDPAKGPRFSADFTERTVEGVPKQKYHEQVIFDGTILMLKDYEARQYVRTEVLPPGSKPGDAVSLNGALPLPIGLDVEDVARNFTVTLQPSKSADQTVLRLVPFDKEKFKFKQLEVVVDGKLALPVKMLETALGDNADVTTIVLKDLTINSGAARLADTTPPAGWTDRAATAPAGRGGGR